MVRVLLGVPLMANIFIISDTHFSHENMALRFLRADGTRLRPFTSVAEMDETMVERWNAVVRPQDHVYHLGDVAMRQQAVDAIMPRLHGHLRLVRGNHDIFRTKLYLKYFDEIHGCRVLDNFIFTHVPVHSDCLGRFKANVHGHLHANRVMTSENRPYLVPDPRYLSVCVEQPWMDYAPIALETLKTLR